MLRKDIHYALRLMRRSPGFTAVAVLSLALGIGANTAIFSLFYTVMLRQLPVARPEQLVEFLWKDPVQPRDDGPRKWEDYEHFRDHNHVFSDMTGVNFDNLAEVRTEGGEPETLILEGIAGNYFQVLGLKPAIGRLTGPEDVPATGDADVVVVSWSWWNSHFHRDPAVLGKRIWYQDAPKTIVGVAPRTYTGLRVGNRADIWLPYQKGGVRILGRLKPGVTLEQAQAEMNVLYQSGPEMSAASANSKLRQRKVELEPAGAGLVRVRDQYGRALVLVMARGGPVASAGLHQYGEHAAGPNGRGGSGKWPCAWGWAPAAASVVRQMLTESAILSAAGTLAGLVRKPIFGTSALVGSRPATSRISTSRSSCSPT